MTAEHARRIIAASRVVSSMDLSRTIGRLTGLAGFEPETRDLNPEANESDAIFVGEMITENRNAGIETVIVRNQRKLLSVWVRTTDFWTLTDNHNQTATPKNERQDHQ